MPMDGSYSTDFLLKTQVIRLSVPHVPRVPRPTRPCVRIVAAMAGGSLNSTPERNVALPVYGEEEGHDRVGIVVRPI
jgi:hypothetical protein